MRVMFIMYIVVAIVVYWGIVSQVIMPLERGTQLFPIFRKKKKEQELEKQLKDVAQAEVEKELLDEIKERRKNLKGKK